ncbi:hypothetical protein [Candidatus Nanohalovita haloferacivicina]|uniref:hypothetical protein n=1 Tax=Candidatus Nanohalovita haloferacivicina TaxID=2978046 RepID=UPI00325FAF71|nr:hypothetical protein HBNXNv_1087 [Candidatus Nanohalobia archaeon BNXNv]
MNRDTKFHEFVYEIENILDELLIAFLSFGAIVVAVWTLQRTQGLTMSSFGDIISPWIIMLGLMIIGRELWMLNHNIEEYLREQEGE